MVQSNRTSGAKTSIISAVALGLIIALALALLLAAISSCMILDEILPEGAIGIAGTIILAVSTFVGCMAGALKQKGQYAIVCAVCAAVLLLLSVGSNILFCNSSFGAVGAGLISILIGALLSCLVSLKLGAGKMKMKKRRSR